MTKENRFLFKDDPTQSELENLSDLTQSSPQKKPKSCFKVKGSKKIQKGRVRFELPEINRIQKKIKISKSPRFFYIFNNNIFNDFKTSEEIFQRLESTLFEKTHLSKNN